MPAFPRYGHSGIIYQKKFYVFGGKCKSNNYHYLAKTVTAVMRPLLIFVMAQA